MKPILAALAAGMTLGGLALILPARAVPPTATPSPGYEARLQEQRAATTHPPARRPTSAKRFRRGQ